MSRRARAKFLRLSGKYICGESLLAAHAPRRPPPRRSPTLSILIITSLSVSANTYFGAPLMFFFFSGWLRAPQKPIERPSRLLKCLVVGLPGTKAKGAFIILYLALLLAIALA